MLLQIKILKQANLRVLKEVNRLMCKIGLTAPAPQPLSLFLFKDILNQNRVHFIAAVTRRGEVIGILILYFVRIPSGLSAILEDLVVDEKYRRWGVGRLLVERAIKIATAKRARHLSLRTNPARVDANRLYRALGFGLMKTNFYRLNLFR